MTITFKPLWKLLIDRDMTKEDVRLATIAKLGRDGNVTIDALARICQELNGQLTDIYRINEKEGGRDV